MQVYVGLDGPVVLGLLFLVDFRLYAIGSRSERAADHVVLALATGAPLRTMHTEPIQLAGEFSVLFASVPLALLWSTNAWLALFVFAAIASGSVLLHVSETEHRLRIDERTGLANAAAFGQSLKIASSTPSVSGAVSRCS